MLYPVYFKPVFLCFLIRHFNSKVEHEGKIELFVFSVFFSCSQTSCQNKIECIYIFYSFHLLPKRNFLVFPIDLSCNKWKNESKGGRKKITYYLPVSVGSLRNSGEITPDLSSPRCTDGPGVSGIRSFRQPLGLLAAPSLKSTDGDWLMT